RQEPNVESILSANPDLVIIEKESRDDKVIQQIEDQGVPVMVMTGADAKDPIAYMKDTFSVVAQATGRSERAQTVLEDFDATVTDIERDVVPEAPAPRATVRRDRELRVLVAG
ncbi:ABC transporter substrate-binding protein, partial [Mycobacterium tuberculosis]|nr:ABC transporter substrate-binding protein [Mycobacterium tuberculosis]